MYAIVKTGGKQYTVKPGDVFDVEKLPGEAGDTVALQVIFLNDGGKIVTDPAALAGVNVTAQIVEQHKGDRQIVFKFHQRHHYRRHKGHRQQLTKIAIIDVNGETAAAPAPKAAKPAEEKPAEKPAVAKAEKVEEPAKAEEPAKEKAPAEEEAPAQEKAAEPAEEEAPAEEKAPETEIPEDLSKLTVAQLKELAKAHDIKIPSSARKAEIIETIENAL